MKYHTIPLGIVLTFSVLFTASSGVLKGQAFASIEEEIDDYYQNQYDKNTLYETNRGSDDLSFPINTPGVIRGILEGVDIEQLQEIEDILFEGVDKERLLNNALNLLKNLDFEELNEESIPDSWDYLPYGVFLYSYRHSYNLTTMFFLELLIIGVGFGFGSQ